MPTRNLGNEELCEDRVRFRECKLSFKVTIFQVQVAKLEIESAT